MLAENAISIAFFLSSLLFSPLFADEETSVVANEENPILAEGSSQSEKKRVENPERWPKGIENYENGGKVLTRCRFRSINYWNYTQGHATVVLGHQFDSAIGAGQSPTFAFLPSQNVFGGATHPHRHSLRLLSLLNPFFSQLRGNYVLVKAKSTARFIDSQCTVVFIFAQWCPFSMRAAPYVNALARAFPQLAVVAIDVDEYLRFRWSLDVFYIPKIKIFIGDHAYKEFNGTETNLDELVDFVWNNLRQAPQGPLELRREDFAGPIPTQLVERPNDHRLQVVWIIFLLSLIYFISCYVDFRGVRSRITALLRAVGHHLGCRRRRQRRHVAAHAALPTPPPPFVHSQSYTD